LRKVPSIPFNSLFAPWKNSQKVGWLYVGFWLYGKGFYDADRMLRMGGRACIEGKIAMDRSWAERRVDD
jgi:hypothetical protein